MNKILKTCEVCGKMYQTNAGNQRKCQACRELYGSKSPEHIARDRARRRRDGCEIARINRLASASGLSYGHYVARGGEK